MPMLMPMLRRVVAAEDERRLISWGDSSQACSIVMARKLARAIGYQFPAVARAGQFSLVSMVGSPECQAAIGTFGPVPHAGN